MNLLEAAIRYAQRGWYIFPCRPKLKEPYTKGGCRDATTDMQMIRAWWERWPDANIGLLCGPTSGVYVVDIDLDPDKNVNGWKSLEDFETAGNYLPVTVRQESPRGGAHYLYRSDTPPNNKNSFRNGIDIRSDGYYILLTPSVHPNGKTYQWSNGFGPDDIAMADFPDFMRPENEKPVVPWATAKSAQQTTQTNIKHNPEVVDRAVLYLRECEPAIQGHAGHDKLLWAARALIVGFCLDDQTAQRLLETEYNPRCCPPWNLADPKDNKDFFRKVAQAKRTPGQKPAGWLLKEYSLTNDDRMQEYGRNLAESLLKSIVVNQESRKIEQLEETIPEFLIQPVGLVGDICSWINSTARKPQPLLALGNALAFCGTLFGRKVRDEWDTRTNIYCLGVAPSCAGKDHSRSQIKRLVSTVGIADKIMGGEDVTSDAALEAALFNNAALLFQWDEIGHLLKAIKSSAGNPHLSKIVPTLMKLYSAANDTYFGKEYATGDRRDIEQPCCCIYGTTVPSTLWQGMTTDELRDGWLGRCLAFISRDDPETDYEQSRVKDVPKHLIERVTAWHSRDIKCPERGNIASITGCWQITIPHTPEAYQYIAEFERKTRAKRKKTPDEGIAALWGRVGENAAKISLIVAAGDRFDNAEITLEHAIYGCTLAEYLLQTMISEVERHISDSVIEGDKKGIMEMIREAGPKGLAKAEVTRRTQKYNKRQRNEYIDDLVESNQVVYGRNPDKNGIFWLWPYPYGLDMRETEIARNSTK